MTLKSRIGDLETDDTADDITAAAVSGAVEDLEALVGDDDAAGDLVTRTAALEAAVGTDDEAGDLFTRVAALESP